MSDVDEIDYSWINPLEDLEIVPTHDLCANLQQTRFLRRHWVSARNSMPA
jgi:hypothetical protein